MLYLCLLITDFLVNLEQVSLLLVAWRSGSVVRCMK